MKKSIFAVVMALAAAYVFASDSAGELYRTALEKMNAGEYADAVAELDKAISIDPKYYDAYCLRGFLKGAIADGRADNDYSDGLKDLNTAIRLEPDGAEAYFYRGVRLARLHSFKEALADFDKVIELEPGNADAYYNRSEVYRLTGRIAERDRDYKTAVKLGFTPQTLPGSGMVWFYIAGIIVTLLLVTGVVVWRLLNTRE